MRRDFFKDKKNIIIIILIVSVIGLLIGCFVLFNSNNEYNINPYDIKVKSNDNFVFLGDSITDYYPLDELYEDIPVINSGVAGYTTDDIISNLDEMVYIYNPTKVIILIGTNDIIREKSISYIINNIKTICKKIKKNRPNAKIYIESLYPINNSDDDKINHDMVSIRTNNEIMNINKKIKKYCEKENYTYINIYKSLTDEKGNLKIEYTVDGLHMSDLGYLKITKLLYPYLQD